MGTDIYAYVEVQDEITWSLLYLSDLYFPRSYTLFGLMAGVRGDVGAFLPRGVPADMSKALAKECWSCHSASWLTQQEFTDVVGQYDPEMTRDHGFLREVMDMMQDAKGRPTRLVFWFD